MPQRVPFRLRFRRRPLTANELSWINGFYAHARKHLFVRKEDNVLIIPPNKVYKLNSTGTALLEFLARGRRIEEFPGLHKSDRVGDVDTFFKNLRQLFAGEDPDSAGLSAVERIAYDFSYTKLPVLGEIAVTYRCNNRCAFCYVSDTPDREMSVGEIKKIIRIFKVEAQIPFFSFTGGEPLLRKDLERCIAYAAKKGLTVNLITNGTLCTQKRARSLAKAGLRTAQVSIEAPEEALHDELTGRPGSFNEALKGMRAMQEAGISVQTNTTLTAVNAEAVLKLPGFLKGAGISRFSVNLYIPTGKGKDTPRLFLPYTEAGPYIDRLRRQAAPLGLTFYWYSPMPYCIYNPIAKGLGNKSCAAVDGLVSVNPKGEVLPCSSYNEPVGNLLTGPFSEVWFSERGSYFKNKRYAPEECRGCSAFTACQGACPLYWNYAGTNELSGARHPGADEPCGMTRCSGTNASGHSRGSGPGPAEQRSAACRR
jgi:radical SAM protein with 4Fe4S-binding SPASM domain